MQPPAEYPPIVIRGAGVVSPCGSTLDDFWDGLVAAEQTAATLLQFEELEGFKALGCPASGFDPASRFERHELRRLDRSHQLAFWAAEDALEAADDGPEPERCAVVVGIGIGAIGYLENQFHTLMQRGLRSLSPLTIPVSMPNSIAGHLSMRHGYRGPAITVAGACASGAMAIGEALWLLRSGRADRVLAGGVEAMNATGVIAAFSRMEAMSTRFDDPTAASRPFDVDRDGFVLGEGAGFVVLERADEASSSDLGAVLGYGCTSDAENIVAPAADGAGARSSMELAIADAGLQPTDITHVNAHGTSTKLNDSIEGAAIREVFGEHRPPVTAGKSVHGHLIGAAGAVEAIATMLSVRNGSVPPIANLDNPDKTIEVDLVSGTPRNVVGAGLSNSFAFGGHNASLVIA